MELHRHWPSPVADATGLRDRLLTAYGDPRRGYHNRTHLTEVLVRVDLVGTGTHADLDRDAVLLGAWFHDAVYEAAADDVEQSALLAERELDAAGADAQLVGEVVRLVRLTATHVVESGDLNGAALCDADLGILAADEGRYAEYVAGVRQEYAAVPDADFARGRAEVLRTLADRPRLFHTAYGREHWETPARQNLERELRRLEPR